MKLPPHYHSDLMNTVEELENEIPKEIRKKYSEKLSEIKEKIVKLGIKSHANSGHFYSPVVNPNNIHQYYKDRWSRRQDINAIYYIDVAGMAALWNYFLPHMTEYHFHEQPAEGKRYYSRNIYLGISDASILVGVLKHFKPSRYLEIGSGFSSALALDVTETADWTVTLHFVEPYPEARLDALLTQGDRDRVRVSKAFVQDIPLAEFQTLGRNDVLFIDSTHIVKSGSDVIFLYLEVLNRLQSGVLVHIHDIFFPFEYPPHWVLDQNRSWNEAYMLEALLAGGRDFEVLFFNDAFGVHFKELIGSTYPPFLQNGGSGGSIWLRKR